MATTVISQIVVSDTGMAADITGTVGGTAHLWRRSGRPFIPKSGTNPPTATTPQVLAQEFADHYAAQIAASGVLDTVSYTLPVTNTTVAIAFNSTSTTEVGYGQLEIGATVATVATVIHMEQDHFISMYRNLGTAEFTRQLAVKLYEQYKLDIRSNTSGSDYIASFTTT